MCLHFPPVSSSLVPGSVWAMLCRGLPWGRVEAVCLGARRCSPGAEQPAESGGGIPSDGTEGRTSWEGGTGPLWGLGTRWGLAAEAAVRCSAIWCLASLPWAVLPCWGCPGVRGPLQGPRCLCLCVPSRSLAARCARPCRSERAGEPCRLAGLGGKNSIHKLFKALNAGLHAQNWGLGWAGTCRSRGGRAGAFWRL